MDSMYGLKQSTTIIPYEIQSDLKYVRTMSTEQKSSENDGPIPFPVDLCLSSFQVIQATPLKWNFANIPPSLTKISNIRSCVSIRGNWSKRKPYLSGGLLKGDYSFSEIHFHSGPNDFEGSIHTVNGKRNPLEMHCVFYKRAYNSQQEAIKHSDGLAVICYLFKIQNEDNEDFKNIVESLGRINGQNSSEYILDMPISQFVPVTERDYALYWGVTGCESDTKLIKLIVMVARQPIGLSRQQVSAFRNSTGPKLQPFFKKSMKPPNRQVFLVNPSLERHDFLYLLPFELPDHQIGKRKAESLRLQKKYLSNDYLELMSDQKDHELTSTTSKSIASGKVKQSKMCSINTLQRLNQSTQGVKLKLSKSDVNVVNIRPTIILNEWPLVSHADVERKEDDQSPGKYMYCIPASASNYSQTKSFLFRGVGDQESLPLHTATKSEQTGMSKTEADCLKNDPTTQKASKPINKKLGSEVVVELKLPPDSSSNLFSPDGLIHVVYKLQNSDMICQKYPLDVISKAKNHHILYIKETNLYKLQHSRSDSVVTLGASNAQNQIRFIKNARNQIKMLENPDVSSSTLESLKNTQNTCETVGSFKASSWVTNTSEWYDLSESEKFAQTKCNTDDQVELNSDQQVSTQGDEYIVVSENSYSTANLDQSSIGMLDNILKAKTKKPQKYRGSIRQLCKVNRTRRTLKTPSKEINTVRDQCQLEVSNEVSNSVSDCRPSQCTTTNTDCTNKSGVDNQYTLASQASSINSRLKDISDKPGVEETACRNEHSNVDQEIHLQAVAKTDSPDLTNIDYLRTAFLTVLKEHQEKLNNLKVVRFPKIQNKNTESESSDCVVNAVDINSSYINVYYNRNSVIPALLTEDIGSESSASSIPGALGGILKMLHCIDPMKMPAFEESSTNEVASMTTENEPLPTIQNEESMMHKANLESDSVPKSALNVALKPKPKKHQRASHRLVDKVSEVYEPQLAVRRKSYHKYRFKKPIRFKSSITVRQNTYNEIMQKILTQKKVEVKPKINEKLQQKEISKTQNLDTNVEVVSTKQDQNCALNITSAIPETTLETTPETTPETIPETTPETTLEKNPETTLETTSETTLKTVPENTPKTIPETTPKITPENQRRKPMTADSSSQRHVRPMRRPLSRQEPDKKVAELKDTPRTPVGRQATQGNSAVGTLRSQRKYVGRPMASALISKPEVPKEPDTPPRKDSASTSHRGELKRPPVSRKNKEERIIMQPKNTKAGMSTQKVTHSAANLSRLRRQTPIAAHAPAQDRPVTNNIAEQKALERLLISVTKNAIRKSTLIVRHAFKCKSLVNIGLSRKANTVRAVHSASLIKCNRVNTVGKTKDNEQYNKSYQNPDQPLLINEQKLKKKSSGYNPWINRSKRPTIKTSGILHSRRAGQRYRPPNSPREPNQRVVEPTFRGEKYLESRTARSAQGTKKPITSYDRKWRY